MILVASFGLSLKGPDGRITAIAIGSGAHFWSRHSNGATINHHHGHPHKYLEHHNQKPTIQVIIKASWKDIHLVATSMHIDANLISQ